jgi:hypothetical protein
MNSAVMLRPMTAVLPVLLWILVGCSDIRSPAKAAQATWSLQLQEGFRHERVIVFADNQRVFSGLVTTDSRIGFAKSILIPIHDPRLQLRIEIPTSGAVYVWSLDLRRGRVLGLERDFYGRPTLSQQTGPFFYE